MQTSCTAIYAQLVCGENPQCDVVATSISSEAPAPTKFELLAGPMVIIHTKLLCRLTCNLCWALDGGLVCPMHRQLTPSHAQQIVSGIQWVLYTGYT